MFAEMKEGRVLVSKAVSLRAASWSNQGQAALNLMGGRYLPPEEVARLCLCVCACTPNTRGHESAWQPPVVPLFCLPNSLAAPPPPVPSSSANPCAQLLPPLPRHPSGRLGSPYAGSHIHQKAGLAIVRVVMAAWVSAKSGKERAPFQG